MYFWTSTFNVFVFYCRLVAHAAKSFFYAQIKNFSDLN